jgi:putative hydrolase of the HAD superfamily
MTAVILDVGGVLLVPDTEWIAARLAEAGIEFDRSALARAHYYGMAAVDAAAGDGDLVPGTYMRGYLRGLGVEDEDLLEAGSGILLPWMRRPTPLVWTSTVAGSAAALGEMGDAGIPLAVVSNSDGRVEEQLRQAGLCQVGPGRGTPVAAIVDSGAVGFAKPDPAIFEIALEALGVRPSEAVHVGDSVYYDVGGARAAGVRPLHFDPYGCCASGEHEHVRSLLEVISPGA